MTVLVVESDPSDGPGLLTAHLDARVVRPHAGDQLPNRAPGGLVVLGGEQNAYDDERCPWLPATKELLRRCVADEVPTLAICLGAQLLAVATGGEVAVPSPTGSEQGAGRVQLAGAPDDDLFRGLPASMPVFQWHDDAIVDLPPNAVVLASSAACAVQAFRLGRRAWGVQWHPEVDVETVAGWASPAQEGLLRVARRAEPAVLQAAGVLISRFAGVVQRWGGDKRSAISRPTSAAT